MVVVLPNREHPYTRSFASGVELTIVGLADRAALDQIEGINVRDHVVWVDPEDGTPCFHAMLEVSAGKSVGDYASNYQLRMPTLETVCDPTIVDPCKVG